MGFIFKGLSIVLLILDFIGSIFLGNELGGSVFFIALLSGAIFCLVLYAIGAILDEIAALRSDVAFIARMVDKRLPQEQKVQEQKPSQQSYFSKAIHSNAVSGTGGAWICKSCSTKNESTARFCKGCGKYK